MCRHYTDYAMNLISSRTAFSISKLKNISVLATPREMSTMSALEISTVLRLVFAQSVQSVLPSILVKNELLVSKNNLTIRDKVYKLDHNCHIVGFGKAVLGMAVEAEQLLGRHLKSGIISIPEGQFTAANCSLDVIQVFEGAKNNIPDARAEQAAIAIKNLVETLSAKDLLVVLISGGGSALLPLPITPVTLDDEIAVIKLMVNAGADIVELNSVRKRLSLLKGGGLAALAYPVNVVSLVLSDIIGDPLDMIASGPTVVNCDPIDAPLNILAKYNLVDIVSKSVLNVLRGPVLNRQCRDDNVQNIIIGNNKIALQGALLKARQLGFNSLVLSHCVQGLVSDVVESYIALSRILCQFLSGTICGDDLTTVFHEELFRTLNVSEDSIIDLTNTIVNKSVGEKFCFLLGGETTVEINGTGLGGRCQELGLRFAIGLKVLYETESCFEGFDIYLLAAGTDGIDGPTDAAGVIAYSDQITCAIEQGLNPKEYLDNNDSYNFYSKLNNGNDLIKIGHTGTNVMDIHILTIQRKIVI